MYRAVYIYICPFGCRNPIWNPTLFYFFFPVESQMESLAFLLESQQNGIPGESHTLFLESFRQLLESQTSASLFSEILCLFCIFQMGLGNRYLGRQKLVRVLVSETSLFYTIRLNTNFYRYLFFKYYILCKKQQNVRCPTDFQGKPSIIERHFPQNVTVFYARYSFLFYPFFGQKKNKT